MRASSIIDVDDARDRTAAASCADAHTQKTTRIEYGERGVRAGGVVGGSVATANGAGAAGAERDEGTRDRRIANPARAGMGHIGRDRRPGTSVPMNVGSRKPRRVEWGLR
jgi:hypothetical protein